MTCLNFYLLRCRQSTMPPHRLIPPPYRLNIHSAPLCGKWTNTIASIYSEKTGDDIMSGNVLKFIAIITMLIDHIGAVIIENGILHAQNLEEFSAILATPQGQLIWNADFVVRCIGRLAFPIFCFLLVGGISIYTKCEKICNASGNICPGF